MLTNGFLKNKKTIKSLQKALLTGLGIAGSKGIIIKAFTGIYDDVQKITRKLVQELEQQGQIKTKEAKKIIKELQKKSDEEKVKIYKRLQKDLKLIFTAAKDIVLTPINLIKETQKTQSNVKSKKGKKKSRKTGR